MAVARATRDIDERPACGKRIVCRRIRARIPDVLQHRDGLARDGKPIDIERLPPSASCHVTKTIWPVAA